LSAAAICLAATSTASFESNLNYDSPSKRHPALSIEVRKVVARNTPQSAWDPKDLSFTHGVASGDPLDNSVILWTRAAPSDDNDRSNITVSGYAGIYSHETEKYIKASKAPVCVSYKVASDKGLTKVVDKGTIYTSSDVDYTVKIEAKKLQPFTQYCEFTPKRCFFLSANANYLRLSIQHL
jgi:alkaline phosphatase D